MKQYSKNQVRDGLIEEFKTAHKTLATSEDSSLVQFDLFSSPQHHLLRVLSSYYLSPILGDHLYGNRVANVLGTRLAISPIQANCLATFHKIPATVLQRLHLSEPSLMPTCLHLKRLTLSRYHKEEDLIIEADPPPWFNYVCNSLQLEFPLPPPKPIN